MGGPWEKNLRRHYAKLSRKGRDPMPEKVVDVLILG